MAKLQTESVKRLYETILKLESAQECAKFFEDICTIKEIKDMAQRLDIALMLDEGKNYQDITETTGISTATISRVSRCLNYGEGGYKLAISKIKNK